MNHLEKLLKQYYEWKGYIVKSNVRVGKLPRGGWAGELDIIAYHPTTDHLIHLEPSIDANTWKKREEKFTRKFDAGKKYIYTEVFPWLEPVLPLEQVAVLPTPSNRVIGGGSILSIDEFMKKIRNSIAKEGTMGKNAIPEEYDLLRTMQMTINGYHAVL